MRDVIKPSKVPTLRPLEGALVLGRSRDQAPYLLILSGAMPLSIDQHVSVERPPSGRVLARGVLAEIHRASGELLGR